MAKEPFKEDFFERVIDVKWETEPEVYWLVGSGGPTYVNGMGSINCCVYRSSDGKRWYGTQQYYSGGKGIGALFAGCWMRENLTVGATPVWILGGGSSRTQATACISYSTDGENFDNKITFFDQLHLCAQMYPNEVDITMLAQNTVGNFLHYDPYTSYDGQAWKPNNYHGGETDLFLAAAAAPASHATLPVPRSSVIRAVNTNSELLQLPGESALMLEPTPMSSKPQKRGDDTLFVGTGTYAIGKVRKGPFRGKRLMIQIDPYHYFAGGGDHGDNLVKVYLLDRDAQKYIGQYKMGVARSISIGYGHYTFVVTGSSGNSTKGQMSTISWSEDGLKWHRVDLGRYGQINAIAVGPRPSDKPPQPPQADEITNGGNTVGGRPPTFPTS